MNKQAYKHFWQADALWGRLALITLVWLLSGCGGAAGQLAGAALGEDGVVSAAAAELQAQAEGTLTIDYAPTTGVAHWVAAEGGAVTRQFARQNLGAEGSARAFMGAYGRLFGVADQAAELQVKEVERDELGIDHVHFQQMQNGVEVFGADLLVHVAGDGAIQVANGYLLPDARTVDVTVSASAATAAQSAIAYTGLRDGVVSEQKTVILNLGLLTEIASPSYLTQQMLVTSPSQPDQAQWVFVDANSGVVRFAYSAITEARNRYTGIPSSGKVRNENDPPVTDPVAGCTAADLNAAHDYAGQIYDFYWNRFGRDSYDGVGGQIISAVCAESATGPNAWWQDDVLFYTAKFPVDDVVGHEFSHGVTDYLSGLIYFGQAGALDEAFSDIMGEALDLTNNSFDDTAAVRWDLTEGIPGGAQRNLMAPTRFYLPDATDSPYYYCGTVDNGGVHVNSGVLGKAFALMVDGGTFNRYPISAMGFDKPLQIIYRANDRYLSRAARYYDAYNAILHACNDLYGNETGVCVNVKHALMATKMNGPICQLSLDAQAQYPFLYSYTGPGAWIYGLTVPATLRPHDYAGYCLNLHGNIGSDGAKVNLWTCNQHNSQLWQYHADDGTVRPKDHPNFCLNLHGNVGADNAIVNLWTCTGHNSQKWNADARNNLHPQDYPGYCLNLQGNGAYDDATINLWNCTNHTSQQWTVTGALDLKNGSFEAGRNQGWHERAKDGMAIVTSQAVAQTGYWLAWLGGAQNNDGAINQDYLVPATGATFTYAYAIVSADSCGHDFVDVRVNSTTLKSYPLCASNATNGYVYGSVSLSAYAGQVVNLNFQVKTDDLYTSSFYLDNVAVTAATTALPEAPDPHALVGDGGEATVEAKPAAPLAEVEEKSLLRYYFLPMISNQ